MNNNNYIDDSNDNNNIDEDNDNTSIYLFIHLLMPFLLCLSNCHYHHYYCRTHNVSVCLYIRYIWDTLYFFLTVLALSVAATVANIKIC